MSMTTWNGIAMYAPQTPEHYLIPGAQRCVFRIMQEHGDTQAWNLYWLSKPETDHLLTQRDGWFQHYHSFNERQTRAFYAALDTQVYNRLTLAAVVALPPREAIPLLQAAQLDKTEFYALYDGEGGGEAWRQVMLGRLFVAARSADERQHAENPADVVWIDFHTRHPTLKNGTRHQRV
ncbi:hypothetical protein VVD49_07530 [Uliginosibacterium sp. H3]|uniref:Uncharacterized protein n=1 Tax=Uliginosibacterium silvisoli TaxID=3114758 RepID=A0ABU6K1N4_9RHOO|nr:hypothetical protein [Uliginosibacterium sp. H3]